MQGIYIQQIVKQAVQEYVTFGGRDATAGLSFRACEAVGEMARELKRATDMHGNFNSAHEGYAVILEELDELKEHVWMRAEKRDKEVMRKEAIQVAAMAMRFVLEVCNHAD